MPRLNGKPCLSQEKQGFLSEKNSLPPYNGRQRNREQVLLCRIAL